MTKTVPFKNRPHKFTPARATFALPLRYLSPFNYQLSTVNYQLSTINCQLNSSIAHFSRNHVLNRLRKMQFLHKKINFFGQKIAGLNFLLYLCTIFFQK